MSGECPGCSGQCSAGSCIACCYCGRPLRQPAGITEGTYAWDVDARALKLVDVPCRGDVVLTADAAKQREVNEHGYGGKSPVGQLTGIAEYLPAIRPPIERYLRCTVTFGSWTIEPGLQYDRGERLAPLLSQLQLAIGEAWKAAAPVSIDDVPRLNEAAEQLVTRLWPDRAWFLEVHHTTAGWTQIYQPYGIPRTIR